MENVSEADEAETMELRIENVSLGTEERLTVQEHDSVRDVKQRLHEMNPTDGSESPCCRGICRLCSFVSRKARRVLRG